MRTYYVYVIQLEKKVANLKKFRLKNPKYLQNSQCFYVGQSFRIPAIRFEQHKEGYKSNKYAKLYGLFLRPDLYEKYNPIPSRQDAIEIEKMIAFNLRAQCYGVWFN
tara:strand:+ start:457 stop:777 length:321 start_codon:yes stop_codon:yes gene_type:complete